MLIWEQIDHHHFRAKVLGGWLVKAYEDMWKQLTIDHTVQGGYNFSIAMCFVPDANHCWDLVV